MSKSLPATSGDEVTAQRNEEAGARATLIHKAGEVGFGLRPSKQHALTLRRQSTALTTQALEEATDEQDAFERLQQLQDALDIEPQRALRQARHLDQAWRQRDTEADVQAARELQEYAAQNSLPMVDSLATVAPEVQALRERLRAIPLWNGVQALEQDSTALRKDTGKLLAAADVFGKKSNLPAVVDREWKQCCRLRGAVGDVPEVDDPPVSSCWKANRCLHTQHGKQLHRFRNAFLRTMKLNFGTGVELASQRHLLSESKIVGRLTGTVPGSPGEDLTHWMGSEELYFHIADMCFSPYEPFVDIMHVVEERDDDFVLSAVGPGEVALKVPVAERKPHA